MRGPWQDWFLLANRWLVRPKKVGMLHHYEVYNPALGGEGVKPYTILKDALWEAAKRNTEGYQA